MHFWLGLRHRPCLGVYSASLNPLNWFEKAASRRDRRGANKREEHGKGQAPCREKNEKSSPMLWTLVRVFHASNIRIAPPSKRPLVIKEYDNSVAFLLAIFDTARRRI